MKDLLKYFPTNTYHLEEKSILKIGDQEYETSISYNLFVESEQEEEDFEVSIERTNFKVNEKKIDTKFLSIANHYMEALFPLHCVLEKSYTLEKSEHGFFNFPESGVNWGRYGTRDSGKSIGGDNWAKEECVAALLGFFYSVKESGLTETLYYNDISSHDGTTNLGHETHKTGKDIDIRYPGCTNSDGEQLWTVAKQYWGS